MKNKFNSACILAMLLFVLNLQAQMRVHLINVGQGSSTLIEFPCAAILIDTGGESNSLFDSSTELKAYLDDFFDRRTDLNHTLQCVYLTHPHSDHTLGVPVILQAPYKIKNAVTDGLEQGSGKPGQVMLHRAAQSSESNTDPGDDIGFEAVTTTEIGPAGLTNKIIDPVDCTGVNPVITALWGASPTNPGWTSADFGNENNHSVVLKIEYGASSMLITGDLEAGALKSLLAKYAGTSILDADVYLTGHHGSKNGTTTDLLSKVTPQMALISMGDLSRKINWTAWAYGHPNKDILDMLQNSVTKTRPSIKVQAGTGAKTFVDYTVTKAIYATGWDGDVLLEADAAHNWKRITTTMVPATVNVNTASLSQLESLPGIGNVKAQAVIKYRTANGNFSALQDLGKVPGFGAATIELVKPYVSMQ